MLLEIYLRNRPVVCGLCMQYSLTKRGLNLKVDVAYWALDIVVDPKLRPGSLKFANFILNKPGAGFQASLGSIYGLG